MASTKRKAPPPSSATSSNPTENPPKKRKSETFKEPAPSAPIQSKTPLKRKEVLPKREVKVNEATRRKPKIVKLTPARPGPKVPASSNATGPYSSQVEGKNLVCVTRRVELGAYLRRCVDLVKKDGYDLMFFYAIVILSSSNCDCNLVIEH